MELIKILFFARDPGGVNVILPVYKKCQGRFETLLYAKDFALKKIMSQGDVPVKDIARECGCGNYSEVLDFLAKTSPDFIVTGTSLDDFTERYLWKASEELHIKSFAILDQWMNLGIRFSEFTYAQAGVYEKQRRHCFLPYRICVMDRLAEEILIREGIEKTRIAVTGQPHFDTVFETYQKAEASYPGDCLNIVFVSEPILQDYDGNDMENSYWGYNEKSIFFHLYDCLKTMAVHTSKNIRIILRPHPRENVEAWFEVTNPLENENIRIIIDRGNDSFSVLKSADIVCGMSSMFLLEAVICGKPILSIEIGLCRENPFVLHKTGICESVLTREELSLRITRLIEDIQAGKPAETVNFEFKKGAAADIISAVEKESEK